MKKPAAPKRILLIAAAAILSGALCLYGGRALYGYFMEVRDLQAYRDAKRLLDGNRPDKAFSIITARNAGISGHRAEWEKLEIATLAKLRNINRLQLFYDRHPAAFRGEEEASLLVARSLLAGGDREGYAKLRNAWGGGGAHPAWWFALDVDALIIEGRNADALKLLNSRSFTAEADALRLTRLALLTAPKNLYQAWQYLDQAFRAAPKNPDVRSFRAQILEQVGKLPMARVEYVAAFLADPENPLYRDQLAEFYRRHGELQLALQTWATGLDERSADFIRLKALFWSRIATPVAISKIGGQEGGGGMHGFAAYLQGLPAGRFWDEQAFEEIPGNAELLEGRQESFWLRLLQALKAGDEKKAYGLVLTRQSRKDSWSPEILGALEKVLAYRLGEPLPGGLEGLRPAGGSQSAQRHQLFGQLDHFAATGEASPELRCLLKSREAYAAIFMAGGWMEATLQLQGMRVVPGQMPDWFAYGMTQAIRFNRGVGPALAFAEQQQRTPVLELLIAELQLADNRSASAVMKLEELSGRQSDVGYRAAWLLALARLEQGDLTRTRMVLDRQPKLRDSTTGKELQARMALAEGDPAKARRIYESIAAGSPEAMAYLARMAYREKEWKTARMMTLALEKQFPDNMQLRLNMKAIDSAEQRR